MKKRLGFVSNSSSSSFVASAPKKLKKLEITITVDLEKDLGAERFSNLEDWTKHIESEYGWGKYRKIKELCEADEGAEHIYNEGKEALENGLDIVWMTLCNQSGNPMDKFFYEDSGYLEDALERSGCEVLIIGG